MGEASFGEYAMVRERFQCTRVDGVLPAWGI